MHDGWVPRDHGGKFDRKLITRGLKVVVAEVKDTNLSVSIHGVNNVTTCLVTDLAMGNIEFSNAE